MIQIGTVIPDLPLVLGYKVSGVAGDKNQEEIFLEFGFAAQQREIFESAGYKDMDIKLTHLTLEERTGDWYFVKIEGQTIVNKGTVAAKYSRRDINPGINVYDYDERVLGRTPGMFQILVSSICSAALLMAVCCAVGAVSIMVASPVYVFASVIPFFAVLVSASRKGKFAQGIIGFGQWFVGIPPCRK